MALLPFWTYLDNSWRASHVALYQMHRGFKDVMLTLIKIHTAHVGVHVKSIMEYRDYQLIKTCFAKNDICQQKLFYDSFRCL